MKIKLQDFYLIMETQNKTRQRDLEELAQEKIFDELNNSKILVTGATGLIGSEIVLSLLCANRLKNLNIKVIAMVRNEQKAKKIFSCVLNNPNFEIFVQNINTVVNYEKPVDYIIHTACATSSHEMITNPVETIMTIVNGTYNILQFASEKNTKSVVYISSSEVYGKLETDKENVKETDMGYINPDSTRSGYPTGKRTAELLCKSFFEEYGLNVKIVRPTLTFGAGADYKDPRVFGQFARSIAEKKDIVLHTDGSTVRDFLYIKDAVLGILTVLCKGERGEAYNLANPETKTSIRDMAQMLTSYFGGIKVVINDDGNSRRYAPQIKQSLDTQKIEKLGWKPDTGLLEMYKRMLEGFSER